jgi:hypothetical protein
LLLIGAAGMSFCLAITAYAFYKKSGGGLVLVSLMGYIGFFAFSQGSVIWVFLSEIFPNACVPVARLWEFRSLDLVCVVSGLSRSLPSNPVGMPFCSFPS